MNTRFKTTDSSLTPEQDFQTTVGIHLAGTARFMRKLVDLELFDVLDPEMLGEQTMPHWSVMHARRWRSNYDAGLIARGFLMRMTGDPVSVAVFASASATITSAVERAVGRASLAGHMYLAVIADRELQCAPRYSLRIQSPIEPDAIAITGIRSDLEIINHLQTRSR